MCGQALTGLAQIRGWRGETETEAKLLHRIESDLEYIDNWSLLLDVVILARTVAPVLARTQRLLSDAVGAVP